MHVLRRHIAALAPDGLACLGAVAQENTVLIWPTREQNPASARAVLADRLREDPVEQSMPRLTLAPAPDLVAPEPEPRLLAGRTVLVALRTAETADAVLNWLQYHVTQFGVDGALIFDRAKGDTPAFCATLDIDIPVLVVTAEHPTGQTDGEDMRWPETAPAAPKHDRATASPWQSTIQETALFDMLRYRFLSKVRAVAFLDIADLLLPLQDGGTVFDHALAAPDAAIMLRGIEAYPWRLRQGAPAPHVDHIATRHAEQRGLISWAVAPRKPSPRAFWHPRAPLGLPKHSVTPAPFLRAMGIVYPGVPVNRIVRRSDLREQPGLVDWMTKAFGAMPLRVPAPSVIPPRPNSSRLTVVTAMKNEGPFVLDWIAHNRAIGVSDTLVYTNDCEDGCDRLLALLGEAGVTCRNNPYRETGQVPQYAAFRAAEAEPVVQEADWLMTLDVDEYLNIHVGNGTLEELLEAIPDAHAISVPWRLFGNSDRHAFEDRPVAEQFTLCAPEYSPRPLQAWAFKTLYRNEGFFRRLGVHRPKGLAREYRDTLHWMDATGTRLPAVVWDKAWRMCKAYWGYTNATLNHYSVRSAESFLIKRQRGKANRTDRDQGLGYWFRMNHNAEVDRSILRMTDKVAAEKAALLALPGVKEMHAASVAWHKDRISCLLAEPDHAALFDQITSTRMQNLSRLVTNFGILVHHLGPQVIPDDVATRDPSIPFYWSVKTRPGK